MVNDDIFLNDFLSVDGLKEMRGGEYVLDGYITLDKPRVFNNENGREENVWKYGKEIK